MWAFGTFSVSAVLLVGTVSVSAVLLVTRSLWTVQDRLWALAKRGSERRQRRARPVETEDALVVICWGRQQAPELVREAILQQLTETSQVLPVGTQVEVELVDEFVRAKHSAPNLMPITKPIAAQVSIVLPRSWKESGDTEKLAARLKGLECFSPRFFLSAFVYTCQRTVYTEYGEYDGDAVQGWDPTQTRDSWASRERSPFHIAHTAFSKDIPRHAEYDNPTWAEMFWFSTQSPMSEIIQPRARYVRNLVVSYESGAPPFAGFVIEAWPSLKHMNNPFYFFHAHGPLQLVDNLIVMLYSTMRFTSLSTLQGVIMSEYLCTVG